MKINLIDFGVSTKYLRTNSITKEKVHVKHRKTGNFYGNFAFASPNAHKKNVLTRRDDFYQILYFLSYLLTNQLLFFPVEHDVNDDPIDIAAKLKIKL